MSELPINLQAKLLRVIEEREVTPVGLTEPVPVDVTMILASAQRLKSIVESGAFREDLYFRLNVIELDVPTLQQWREDIPELARHFLDRVVRRISTTVTGFSTDAISALMQYAWPGNIRELRNVVERAVVLCSSNEILPTDLPHEIADCGPTSELSEDHKSVMRNYERDLILKALQSADGDKKTAAKLLGMGLSTLYRKLEEFGIE